MCHCKFCQRATGGAYLVEPVFEDADFAMTKGSPKTYNHISAGSGKKVRINFCDNCGTKLFLTFERFKGAVGVYGGTLDDPNWVEITPDNSKHIFLGVAQSETIIPAHINAYTEHATLNDGTPIAPTVFDRPQRIGDL
ncbi:GFA family protein [Thalassovita sp.]|uniref:GFA family protein n=1 Tax=Thalassovita sp. TaxID=1979401 RepID=UPI002B276090|nr:GFA family protein [Thalassovita sp.]